MATALKIYFRKIYLLNEDKVLQDVPLIIAANHPMAFCDACLLACFLNRPLHFLVRGDVFVDRWKWFFRWTNQIPIYRFRDGFGNMRKNTDSFQQVHKHLKEGAAVLIFAEGNTKLHKHLAPLQKGPARIALGAIEEGAKNLHILPIGINYTDGRRFRSDVFISIGDPIAVEQAATEINSTKEKITHLTALLQENLKPHVIHCDSSELEESHHQITAKRSIDCRWPILDQDPERFKYEWKLAQQLNQGVDPAIIESLGNMSTGTSVGISRLLAILLLPMGLIGVVLNAPPFFLAKAIAKSRVKIIEFYTPVRIGLTMILELIWLGILLTAGWILLGPAALLLVLLIPLLGYLGVVLIEEVKHPARQR